MTAIGNDGEGYIEGILLVLRQVFSKDWKQSSRRKRQDAIALHLIHQLVRQPTISAMIGPELVRSWSG